MTRRYHANNIYTTLFASIDNSQTTMIVSSVSGFPTISTNETYRLTLSQNGLIEIVTVTSVSGTTLTITRASEGTTAHAFTAGASIELRITANSLDRKADMVSTAGDVLNFSAATSLALPSAAAPTVSSVGQIALDTTDTAFTGGIVKVYNAAEHGLVMMPIAQFTSPTDTYVVTYDNATKGFKLAAGGGGGGGLTAVVDDTSPQLGGALDVNGNAIISASNGNITITPNGTGSVVLDGLSWPQADGSADYVLKTDGSGQLSWVAQSGGGGGGSGDVVGPSSATDNAIARFDTTTGKLIQNSGVIVTDSNNVNGNNLVSGLTVLTSSATLTVASTKILYGNSASYIDITLPVTSTLTQGHQFLVANGNSGSMNFYTSGGNLLTQIGANTCATITCISTSGTGTSSWHATRFFKDYTNISYVGTITSGTWNGSNIAYNYGGTGLNSVAQGDIIYGSSSSSWTTLAKNTTATRYLSNTGTNNNPAWAQINLANGVTGTLPVANGGTGVVVVPKCLVYAGTTSIATSTYTKVVLNSEQYDTNSNFDSTTNYRFTPTVAGKYYVGASLIMQTVAATYTNRILIYKNGVELQRGEYVVGWISSATYSVNIASIIDMNGSTDYIEIYVWQNSGSTLALSTGANSFLASSLLV